MPKFKKNESLNFLWAGKPRSELGKPLGSNLEHVVKMAKKSDNPVSFYCLGEHENEYKSILKKNGVKNVTVVSTDKYIDKIANGKSNFSEQAVKMKSIGDELLEPPRKRNIDKVAFKDAFSLCFLATEILAQIINRNFDRVKKMLESNPGLLTVRETVKDHSGRTITATPFQAALGAEDEDMWQLIETFIDRLRNGFALKKQQFHQQFPEGIMSESYNFLNWGVFFLKTNN